MSVIDQILQSVTTSTRLNPEVKSVLSEFLQSAGPALETLAPEVIQDIIAGFATGNGAAVAPLAESMTEDQVVAALGAAGQEMNAEADQRATREAAAKATLSAIESAAAAVLARLLISVL